MNPLSCKWEEVDEDLSRQGRKILRQLSPRANQFQRGSRNLAQRIPKLINLTARAFRSKLETPRIKGNRYQIKQASKLIYWHQFQQQKLRGQQILTTKTLTPNLGKIPTWLTAPRLSSSLTNPISNFSKTSQNREGKPDSLGRCLVSRNAESLHLQRMNLKLHEKNLNQKLPMGSPQRKEIQEIILVQYHHPKPKTLGRSRTLWRFLIKVRRINY